MTLNNLKKGFTLESYGIRIGVEACDNEILEEVKKILPVELPERFELVENKFINHILTLSDTGKGNYSLDKNGEKLLEGIPEEDIVRLTGREIRMTVAEFARDKVFVHAGVVGYKGKAIVIPGTSYQGKTTLVAELIKRGALYYSDEYAVLDSDGLVQPFPKMLSIRGIIDDYTQTDFPVETFGGKAGEEKISIGLVLITEFQKGAKWDAERLSTGQGIMEMLKHTIPIRYKPDFTLEVLDKASSGACFVKTKRGEAKEFAGLILEFFDSLLEG